MHYLNKNLELKAVFQGLLDRKLYVVSFIVLSTVLGAIYALALPNVYESKAVLAPNDMGNGSGGTGILGELGGVASLAGFKVPGRAVDKTTIAIQILQSRNFLYQFIERRELQIHLVAAKAWNEADAVIDPEVYDLETKTWSEDVLRADEKTPNEWDLYKIFIRGLNVQVDKNTSLITVTYKHNSPVIAKLWIEWLIKDLNEYMKMSEITEAEKSIQFLKEQINATSVADMQKIFYQLIDKQYQTIMLANVRDEYIFKTIDPPVVSLERIAPNRLLILMASLTLSLLLSIFFVIFELIKRQAPNYRNSGVEVG